MTTLNESEPAVGADPDLTPTHTDKSWSDRTSLVVSIVMLVVVVGSTATVFLADARELKGFGCLALMLGLLFLRIPVGVAIGMSGLLGILAISGPLAVSNAAGMIPYSASSGWSLSVLPMFILMGLLLWRSGATDRIYAATRCWLSWLPGGVAVTTNVAGAGLGAVSGSTLGITYALTRLGVPEMLRSGYDRRLATGSVLVAGLAGQLIPPSVMLVIYAGIANTPVGPQLISGVLPGIALAGSFCLTIVLIAGFRPKMAPKPTGPKLPLTEKLVVTSKALPILLLVVVLLGGIYRGVFTATEAGAFGALTAIVLSVFYTGGRSFGLVLSRAIFDTAAACGGIFLMVISANFLTRMMATSGISQEFDSFVSGLGLGRVSLLLALIVFYLILGCFLEPLTMMLLTVPLLLPILAAEGVSPIWFGVFIVLLMELAIVTPPVGVLSYVVHKVVQDREVSLGHRISLADVFAGGMFFIPLAVGLLVLLIFFPDLALWLPTTGEAK